MSLSWSIRTIDTCRSPAVRRPTTLCMHSLYIYTYITRNYNCYLYFVALYCESEICGIYVLMRCLNKFHIFKCATWPLIAQAKCSHSSYSSRSYIRPNFAHKKHCTHFECRHRSAHELVDPKFSNFQIHTRFELWFQWIRPRGTSFICIKSLVCFVKNVKCERLKFDIQFSLWSFSKII